MRRRDVPLSVNVSREEPPPELQRFSPASSRWTPDDFSAWLRARAAWRDAHVTPLPLLPARERHAMACLDLPAALVEAEKAAPKALPEWRRRQLERGISDPRQVLGEE